MIVWAAGGRDYADKLTIRGALRPYAIQGNMLITGGAPGADLLAESIWRKDFELPYVGLPAQWRKHDLSAGPIRNEHIASGAVFSRPGILIAFPGGRGTADAVAKARAHGIPVTALEDNE